MRKSIFIIIAIGIILNPLLVFGQEDYSKYPGFVDLSKIDEFKESDESLEIFITKPLLSLIGAASSGEEDPSFIQLIRSLALIRVDQFLVAQKTSEDIEKIIEKLSSNMEKKKWTRIVRLKESEERVEIFILNEEKHVAGILIMSLKYNKEATFVNIVGNIDMDQLAKLSQKFNIPKMDSLMVKEKKKGEK